MTIAWVIAAIIWWVVGIASMLWLTRGDMLTYRRLLFYSTFGCFGPAIGVLIAIVAFSQAQFWDYPVFRQLLNKDK